MGKKTYSVTLDEEVVNKAMEKAKFFGGKLSPVINSLLSGWSEEVEESEHQSEE